MRIRISGLEVIAAEYHASIGKLTVLGSRSVADFFSKYFAGGTFGYGVDQLESKVLLVTHQIFAGQSLNFF